MRRPLSDMLCAVALVAGLIIAIPTVMVGLLAWIIFLFERFGVFS